MSKQKIRVVLSSNNQQDVQTLRKVLKECQYQAEITSSDLENPQYLNDKKIVQSARQQVKTLQREFPSYGLFVAFQQGVTKKFGVLFMEVWCYVMQVVHKDDDNEYLVSFGVSSGIKVPNLIANLMQQQEITFDKAIKVAQNKHNSKDSPAELFTGDLLKQQHLIEESMRNALMPLMSNGLYDNESVNPQISTQKGAL